MAETSPTPGADPSTPGTAGENSPSDADRVFWLECRLEQMRAQVDEARAEANRVRTTLAVGAVREADQARRHQLVLEELAQVREETATLHRRLDHSEALRARLEGRLFESDTPGDARELVKLRGEFAAARELVTVHVRSAAELRTRVEALVASREALLTRVAEWQTKLQEGDIEAVDLAEFIAMLRRDILELEHRNVLGERREADLRQQLGLAGREVESSVGSLARAASRATGSPTAGATSPSAGSAYGTDAESGGPGQATPLPTGNDPATVIANLGRLGQSGEDDAFYAIRPSLGAAEPEVRAAAYQALGRLLERDPFRLEPHLRWGIADPDPRVRRRAVLVAASARGLNLRPLLDPLRGDPDPQVRRVVSEVLRRTPAAHAAASIDAEAPAAPTDAETPAGADRPTAAERPTSDEIMSGVAS